jgi:uncharacterized damage-inducible protein DinB
MRKIEDLIEENCQCLQQAIDMMNSISDDVYATNDGACFKSGVGMHIRHITDFYENFLKRYEDRIDYDDRNRDPKMEVDRQYGMGKIRGVMEALEKLTTVTDGCDEQLQVKNDATDPKVDPFSTSSVGRELQFLKFHAVHHYAMIAMILTVQGVEVPADFGYAPSTLQYLKQKSS